MRALAAVAVAVATLGGAVSSAQAVTTTFNATGGEQTFTVPAGTTSLTVTAVGGNGRGGGGTTVGGLGAAVDGATLSVTPGDVLYVEVGASAVDLNGGFNGGGVSGGNGGGGGGGATDLRTVPRALFGTLESRLLVAPGGGGGSYGQGGNWEQAGAAYCAGNGGGAATANAGGAGGTTCAGAGGSAGTFGTGGNGGATVGGGGGGGWYGGGGGGQLGAGGGGSRYVSSSVTGTPSFSNGDGTPRVVLTYEVDVPPVAVDDTKTVAEDSGATTIDALANDTDADGGSKTIATKTNGAHGTVAITNAGADLTYTPDADYCNSQSGGAADTFTYTLNGGSTATVSVTVSCVVDPPSISLTGTPLAYAEDVAATAVDDGVTITDADDANIESGEVTLTNPQAGDELSYATTNGVIGSVNGAKDTVTFSAAATKADYQAALRAVTFSAMSDTPSTTPRTVRFKVNDGEADSNLPTRTINVTAVNDLPVIGLTGTSLAYAENDAATAADGAVTITDPDDANVESGEVKLTNPQSGDELSYATTNGIAGTVNGAKDTVTFSAPGTQANYQTALRAVRFRNTSETPSTTPRSVTFKVNDGDGNSNVPTRTIDVTAVNDGPELNPGGGTGLNYQFQFGTIGVGDGQLNLPYDMAKDSAGNLYVIEASNARVSKFSPSGAFLARWGGQGNANGQFNWPMGITVDANDNVLVGDYNNNRVQKFSSTGTYITKWAASGAAGLEVAPNGDIYVAEYSGNSVKRFSAAGTLITSWGSYGTGNGQFQSPLGVALDSIGNVYVTDHSGNRVQKFTSTGAFIAKWGTSGAGPGQFNYPADIEIDASDNVYVSEWNGNRVQKFTSNGMFLSQFGSYGSKDGQFQGAFGMVLDPEGMYVVDPRNNRVQRFGTGPAPLAYTEGDAATAILPALLATDPEQANLVSATVSIKSGFAPAEDVLAFTDQNGITGSYNASTGVLTLTGTATVAQYQAALRTVTYRNTSVSPATAPRTISFRASDGIDQGTVASRTVNVTPVNTAPTVTTTASTLAYVTNQAATAIDPGVVLADIDNPTLSSASVAITSGLSSAQDVLAYTNANGINGSYNASTGVMTLTGTATLAQYQAALRSVTYRNSSQTPTIATRAVRFTVSDGVATGFGTRNVSVSAPNLAPSMTISTAALSYTENAAATAIDGALTVADPDSPNMASAQVSIGANFSSTQDVLGFASQNGINGTYNAATGMLSLTGTSTRANYETALRSVTYVNTSDNPTVAARTVSFAVNDGTVDSAVKTRQVNVVAVNDPPVVTTTGAPLVYEERSGPQAVDLGIEVSDVDSPQLSLADVQLSGFSEAEDWLSFTPEPGLTIYQPFAPARSYTVLRNAASPATYRAGLRGIKFANTSSKPSTQTRTIKFVVSDGPSATAASRSITINPLNEAPEAKPDSYSTSEATTLTVSASGVLTNDTDPDGPSLSVAQVGGLAANVGVVQTTAKGAKVTINANGSLTYNPSGRFAALNEGDTATDSITYKASDGTATSELASVAFTINGVGSAPVAVDDALSVSEDGTLAEAAPGLLANDAGTDLAVSEVDGSALDVGVEQTTAKGAKVTVNAGGSVSYDPNARFDALDSGETATDSIAYKATDGSQSTNTATLTITITGTNDAPAASANAYSVGEDGTLTRAAPGVLGDDGDVDVEELSVGEVAGSAANVSVVQTTGEGAKVTINADGSLQYDPSGRFEALDAGETDTDSITYNASDGSALSGMATVTFTIDGANDAPDATADAYSVAEDGTLNVPASGVLGNDDDRDVEAIEVGRVAGSAAKVGVQQTTAKGAKVTIDADGTLAYDPNGRFEALDTGETATDSISYEATDSSVRSAPAKVTFTINGSNDAPVGGDDSYDVGQNGTVSIPASGVLANDVDVDVEPATVIEAGGSEAGVGTEIRTERGAAATIEADGSLTYRPDGRFLVLDGDETDTDTFTYRASDGDDVSQLVTVTITVYGANDVPTAIPDRYSVAESGALSISAGGLAGNDGDVDLEGLTIAELEGDPAKVGVEQITGGGGRVTVNTTGSLNYEPNGAYENLDDGETGSDSFTYRVTDGTDTSDVGTVTITTTGENDAPVASADALEVDEDAPLSLASPGVLVNDDDVDAEPLTVSEFAGDPDLVGVQQTTAKGAEVTLEPDGSVSYDPNGRFEALDTGETETDSFQYAVSDGSVGSEPVTATITIRGANDAPSGANDAYSVGEDDTVDEPAAGVLANDQDVDVEDVTVGRVDHASAGVGSELTTAKGGKVTIDADGSLAYDPDGAFEALDSDEFGSDATTYDPSDGTDTGSSTLVTFSVAGANDAPVAVDDALNVAENEVLSVDAAGLLANDTDPDVEALRIDRMLGDPDNVGVTRITGKGAEVIVNSDGSVTYDPNGRFDVLDTGETDTDSLTYRVTDGTMTSNTATLTFTINGANDVPVVTTTSTALAFDQNDAAKDVDGGLTIADTDDTDLAGAQVTITDPHAGDELSYATTAGVTGTVNVDKDTVTLSGTHSVAEYRDALRAVQFYNGANDPSAADRHVTFVVNDGEADSAAATRTIGFTLDTAPPDTEITSGPPAETDSNDPTFVFAAIDPNPGGTLRCRLDGPGSATATYADCSSQTSYEDLDDGAYTFRVFAVDAAGNEDQMPATHGFTVDTTAPTTTSNVPTTVGGSAVTVTLIPSDGSGTGVDKTYFTKGASPADPTTSSAVYDLTDKPTLGDGESIRYFSTDQVGNAESVKSSPAAMVDTTAPTTTDNVPSTVQASAVVVTLSATDSGGSAVDKTYYTKGASPSDPTTSSSVYDVTDKPTLAGGELIRYFSTDQVGNAESVKSSPAAKVSDTPPITTDNVPGAFQKNDVTVTLTPIDGSGAGVDKTYYTTGASPADPTVSSAVYDVASKPTLAGGESIRYFSTDRAGNQESVKSSPAAKVDKIAPVTTDNVPAGAQTAAVPVTLNATDSGGSVIDKTYYTTGASPADPTTSSSVYDQANKPALAGGELIKYFSTDAAGNHEAVKSSPAVVGASAQVPVPLPTTNQIHGTAGNDTINGTPGNDVIYAGAGNDVVNGVAGNDTIYGGEGDDKINGGEGNDKINGGEGNDKISGGAGNDVISGGTGDDVISSADGNDAIYCGAGDDHVDAGGGNDVIDCGDGNDRVDGGAGNDLAYGRGGNDRLLGSAGKDSLIGASGNDRISGGPGKDRIRGNEDRDVLDGGAGNDRLSGGHGNDRVSGNGGHDRIWGGSGNDRLYGGTGNDSLSGNAGNDRVAGARGADRLLGGAGNDRLIGGSGIDVLIGGPGDNIQEQ